MVKEGPAKKLTIYVDETDKFGGRPVYEVLMDLFYKKKIAGVSVFRGIAGYGTDGIFHKSKILELSTSLPLKLEVVDSEEMINKVLPDVYHVVEKGLVEISDTNVVKCCPKALEKKEVSQKSETFGRGSEEVEKRMKLEGKAKMLRVIVSEDDKWEGEPLYEAIVKRFIMMDVAGATVYKAIAGYGPHRRFHKKKTLTSTGELPILITVIDTEENINKILPILDDMVKEGIVILSDVNVIKYTHRDISSEIV
jgi:PII-like signaling protein